MVAMWTRRLGCWFGRFLLLGCVSFAINNTPVFYFAEPPGTPRAANAGGIEKGGRKQGDEAETAGAKKVDDDYVVGPSDVLAINVWKDLELSRNVIVRPDGKISLPLIGELEVSGMTALNIQSLIADKLKEFISKPQVSVIVQEVKSRTYIVVGKIAKPGSYPLGKPTTVLEAIAIAGGFMEFARENKLYVLRVKEDGSRIRIPFNYKKVLNGRGPDENLALKSGDTIVVP